MKQKHALIVGITGQDGSYLAEQLLEKGYKVHGLVRRCSTTNLSRIEHLSGQIDFIPGDLGDQKSLVLALQESLPDEVYNLAAQSFVGVSWSQPEYTMDVNAMGCLRLLEAIRQVKPNARFYQASSSEMFGKSSVSPQTENTPFHPRSPYGVSKVAAYWMTINYRESYGMFACNGILYNHESERRGLEFVTRKISHAVAQISKGLQTTLMLGNLEAKRDWGYSPDYTDAMWLMLQQTTPDDYIIATGITRTVLDFVRAAFDVVGLDYSKYIQIDPKFMRLAEVDLLCGDYSKAKRMLGWEPKTSFAQMVEKMVTYDLNVAE